MSDEKIVVGVGRTASVSLPRVDLAAGIASLTAGTLLVLAVLDLVLIWVPLRVGAVDWEFGSISATLDAFPLLTLTSTVLAALALWYGNRKAILACGFWFGLLAATVAVLGALYGLTAPVVLRAIEAAAVPSLWKALVKTSGQVILYFLLFVLVSRRCITALRR